MDSFMQRRTHVSHVEVKAVLALAAMFPIIFITANLSYLFPVASLKSKG